MFVGKVLAETWGEVYLHYRIEVSKVLRGKVGKTVDVYSENASARVTWDVGRTYVVFAELRDGRLQSWADCGALSDPTKVAQIVHEIELLANKKGAVVEGKVLHKYGTEPGVPGVELRVVGKDASYRVVTDEAGEFRISVPPGHYRMPINESYLLQSIYNMDMDLEHIALTDGQCAQVELLLR